MSSHGTDRISVGRSALNDQAFDSIGVVGAPDLRRVIKHTGIKPSAAARAAFEKDIGEIGSQTVQQLIESQNETMGHLTLPLSRQRMGLDITDRTVEIPFDIADIVLPQHRGNTFIQIITDIFAGHIQNQLVPAENRRPARSG